MSADLKKIAPLVKNQFPSFYLEEGDKFLQFIKAYYEWMDEQGPIGKTRTLLETIDIDEVTDKYIEHFFEKYMHGIPKNVLSNRALLEKHIVSVYRSKGSVEGLKLLFRLLYNMEMNLYIPQDDTLMLSAGKWVVKQYMEVEPREFNYTYDNKFVTGTKSGATGYVSLASVIDSYEQPSDVFFITNIIPGPGGDSFLVGDYLLHDDITISSATMVTGSVVRASVVDSSQDNTTGDIFYDNNILGTEGSGIKFEVKKIKDPEKAQGYIQFNLVNGGQGYALDSVVTIVYDSATQGTGANFKIGSLKDTTTFTYNTNLLDSEMSTIIAPANTQFNANTAVTGNFPGSSSNNTIALSNANTFLINKSVKYTALTGNTAITGLANNTWYYVQFSNDTVIALSTTINGSRIALTPTLGPTKSTGHYLQPNAQFSANLNLGTVDTTIGSCLVDTSMTVGSIATLYAATSGNHQYNGSVAPSVFEKRVNGYNRLDSNGTFWGNNAVITGKLATGNGVVDAVKIVASGYAYSNGEVVELTSEVDPTRTIFVELETDGVGVQEGAWLDNSGFLNSDKYITDSYYYQDYSYEIQVQKSLDRYADVVKKLAHPLGNIMFGQPLVIDTVKLEQNVLLETITAGGIIR